MYEDIKEGDVWSCRIRKSLLIRKIWAGQYRQGEFILEKESREFRTCLPVKLQRSLRSP
jgi:hypothetical protein